MLENLREQNNKLILKYQNNKKKLDKQLLISNILNNNECFFKLKVEVAYNILKDLEIENYKECYKKLVSYSKYSLF